MPPSPARTLTLDEALRSARETKALRVGPGALADVPSVFTHEFPRKHAVVIADSVSFELVGKGLESHLRVAGIAGPDAFVFPEAYVPAEHAFVERVEAFLRTNDAIPIAVGSGTINDLVKLASHRVDRPYLCVATAASMDGYTAFGSSITYRGAKQTFACPAPQAVIADTDIIRRAPPEMTASGYADLLAKVTAGADWILADGLGVEPIDPRSWDLVQSGLRHALADPAGARAGDEKAIAPLVEGLLFGGFAMQCSRSSRPASGAEHQFSHLWDMEHHVYRGQAPSHGFKVGLATLAVTAFYEFLLDQPLDALDVERCCARWPDLADAEAQTRRRFAGSDFVETALCEVRAKHLSREELRTQLVRVRHNWTALRERLRAQLIPYTDMKRRLQTVGAPTEPEEIGLTRERLRDSFLRAQQIRRRFTVLDLAVRTDTLGPGLTALFGPGGRWEILAPARFNPVSV